MRRNWHLVTNGKLIFHELCSEASSKGNHYEDVAQMVERSLCMREVRGSMPRITKKFFKIRLFCFFIGENGKELTTRYKWKKIFHEFCSEASSELEEDRDVSQMVERSLCMQEVRGCSSNGRALALHARGTGIDAPHLQNIFEDSTILFFICS